MCIRDRSNDSTLYFKKCKFFPGTSKISCVNFYDPSKSTKVMKGLAAEFFNSRIEVSTSKMYISKTYLKTTNNIESNHPNNLPKIQIRALLGDDLSSGTIGELIVLKTYASFEDASISVCI